MLPTFLVIGAMKAGTTALYTYLDQHPDVFMSPVKEPNYFAFPRQAPDFQAPIDRRPDGVNHTSVTDPAAYRALFEGSEGAAARGEASHWYLYWPDAPDRIAETIPDVRLVAMLRNPIERAYSEFMHFVRDGDEPLSNFAAALDAEPERIAADWALGRYVDRGRYADQLARYFERFDRDQIRVYLFDDFTDDPAAVLRDLYAFVGVNPDFEPTWARRVNKSGVPKHRWVHRVLTAAKPLRDAVVPLLPDAVVDWVVDVKNQNLDKPEMDPAVRQRLADTFSDDVRRLEAMLDRDLSHWLSHG